MNSHTCSSVDALVGLLAGKRVVALVGAGCSTESGIPDYRGPDGALRARQPMQYQAFVRSAEARARYWARSAIGWPRMCSARPNDAHRALARLEAAGAVEGIITQNVDGLHHAAGSREVVELHGALRRVRCLDCGGVLPRDDVQAALRSLNPEWFAEHAAGNGRRNRGTRIAPDGDAELPGAAMERFRVPACDACGGVLKPDVVFFGENVPRDRVEHAWRVFSRGEVLLVVGSSLTVYSGRRFVYRAREDAIPIAIVNEGTTRADTFAAVKVVGRVGELLPKITARVVPQSARRRP